MSQPAAPGRGGRGGGRGVKSQATGSVEGWKSKRWKKDMLAKIDVGVTEYSSGM